MLAFRGMYSTIMLRVLSFSVTWLHDLSFMWVGLELGLGGRGHVASTRTVGCFFFFFLGGGFLGVFFLEGYLGILLIHFI